jgi:serine protease Do
VLITTVDPNADAAEKGLQRGDLIMTVNNQPVASTAQLIAAVDAARKANRSSVLLLVRRGKNPDFFVGVDITAH